MILNKLHTLSFARLLHVALSLLCVLVLVLGLASGAFASAGDPSGDFSDFNQFAIGANGFLVPFDNSEYHDYSVYPVTVNNQTLYTFLFNFPFEVSSGSVNFGLAETTGFIFPSGGRVIGQRVRFYSRDYSVLSDSTRVNSVQNNVPVPSGSFFVSYTVYITPGSGYNPSLSESYYPDDIGYNSFSYLTSEPPSDQEILDGVSAIAQSLLALETGPYYGVSGVTVDQNGDLQHTLTQNASLEDLLNALGIAGTDTNHVIRGIYNNFGSYFSLYSINDSTSSTTQVYRGLPQYVNALGQSLTDGINRLQRDHDLLYQQTADLSDALYASTFDSTPEKWSVAEWLRGIFTSINDFISSFWSPAETDLKEAAEEGLQEAADRGVAGSADQVGDMDDLGSGFASFGSTGNVGAGDLLDSLTSGDYSFFSQTTLDNLSVHPPVSQSRGFRSAPSVQVEYVDELSKNRAALKEVLGLP